MLYNVTFGNNTFVSDPWTLVEQNGMYFYEKNDINQRIRINLSKNNMDVTKYTANTLQLEPGWKTPQVQKYGFPIPMEFRNNTVNMNSMLRTLNPTNPNSEDHSSILVFVTVVNNYQIIDFETKYQILNTYHKFGMYQGCVVVLNRRDLKEIKNGTLLTVYAYNRKKEVPNLLTVRFKTITDKKTGEKTIDPNVLTTHVTSIKDEKERERVITRATENRNSFLGFKCIVKPKRLLTAVYLVHPDFMPMMREMVRFSNAKLIAITPEMAKDHDAIRRILKEECEEKKVRAITTVGVTISIHDLRASRILFVFGYDVKRQKLHCLKSN